MSFKANDTFYQVKDALLRIGLKQTVKNGKTGFPFPNFQNVVIALQGIGAEFEMTGSMGQSIWNLDDDLIFIDLPKNGRDGFVRFE